MDEPRQQALQSLRVLRDLKAELTKAHQTAHGTLSVKAQIDAPIALCCAVISLEAAIAQATQQSKENAVESASQAKDSTETLIALRLTVEDFANRTVTVTNRLTAQIEAATAQAAESSKEATNLAMESKNLSRKLNRLTKWIVFAAIISAIAAAVQAGTAAYQALHPSDPQVLVVPSPL